MRGSRRHGSELFSLAGEGTAVERMSSRAFLFRTRLPHFQQNRSRGNIRSELGGRLNHRGVKTDPRQTPAHQESCLSWCKLCTQPLLVSPTHHHRHDRLTARRLQATVPRLSREEGEVEGGCRRLVLECCCQTPCSLLVLLKALEEPAREQHRAERLKTSNPRLDDKSAAGEAHNGRVRSWDKPPGPPRPFCRGCRSHAGTRPFHLDVELLFDAARVHVHVCGGAPDSQPRRARKGFRTGNCPLCRGWRKSYCTTARGSPSHGAVPPPRRAEPSRRTVTRTGGPVPALQRLCSPWLLGRPLPLLTLLCLESA
jgi:hypothetical protein